ncbi:MAG: universal stress protein [Candidatus Binatia bacterium]
MYSKILIPLDGSKFAEAVLPYARVLARQLSIAVDFLYVHDPQEPPAFAPFMANQYLPRIGEAFGGAVGSIVETGHTAATIVEVAVAQPESLIAMATHGYSGAKRWLLGSVAEKVLRAAANHILLVRPANGEPRAEAKLTTVLVPLDGSRLAETVLPTVSELASRLSLRVELVRVTRRIYSAPPEAFLPVFGANAPNLKKLWEEAHAEANEYLIDKAEQLRRQGLRQVESVVLESGADGAAAAIVDLANKTADSWVAMCTLGESAIGNWPLGSVTERVVRYTSGPVLVIRPR